MSYGPKQTLKEGYEKFVLKNPFGCWDWKGCCPKNPGYGQFRSEGKIYKAHRASWILNYGEIPKGMFVCHKCDNKRCSNPEHLFLGNCAENNFDSMKKGLCPYIGKKRNENHRTKIFTQDFPKIIKLYEEIGSQEKIAKMFGVSQKTISNVIRKS